jgi:hypothetical protein
LTLWKYAALAVIILSVVTGALVGFFQPSDSPQKQHYYFADEGMWSTASSSCSPIPYNWTLWLEIDVIGNRTGLNLQHVVIFGRTIQVQLPLALNDTIYVAYRAINSTFERVFVPLPNYWNEGDSLQVSLTYYFTGFTTTTDSLPQVILKSGQPQC